MNIILSIIIPVYNVEKYIKRCLNSIYTQSLLEELFEVIIVNDGTPDNSMKVAEEYEQLHTNIILYNKKNGGVSSARNVGISIAKGNYLLFLDPDDSLSYNNLMNVLTFLKDKTAEIFILRSYTINSNKRENYKWKSVFDDKSFYKGEQLLKNNYIRGSVCGCVINRSFLKKYNICFPEGIINFEDTIFMMLCMCYAYNVRFVDIDIYNVYLRLGSASTSLSRDRVIKSVSGLEFIEKYLKTHKLNSLQVSILEFLKYSILSNATLYSIKCENIGYREFVTLTRIKRYLPIKSNFIQQQYWKIKILNTSYRLYYILMSLKNWKWFNFN